MFLLHKKRYFLKSSSKIIIFFCQKFLGRRGGSDGGPGASPAPPGLGSPKNNNNNNGGLRAQLCEAVELLLKPGGSGGGYTKENMTRELSRLTGGPGGEGKPGGPSSSDHNKKNSDSMTGLDDGDALKDLLETLIQAADAELGHSDRVKNSNKKKQPKSNGSSSDLPPRGNASGQPASGERPYRPPPPGSADKNQSPNKGSSAHTLVPKLNFGAGPLPGNHNARSNNNVGPGSQGHHHQV